MPDLFYKGSLIRWYSEGQGPALVFVHGLGGSSSNWFYQRTYFKAGYQVVTLDLPGHGHSEGADLAFPEYKEVLHQLLTRELNLSSVLLCGISMGGKVVLDYTCHYPGQVRGLVLADTFAGMDAPEIAERKAIYDLLDEPGGVEKWVHKVVETMGLDPQGVVAKGFGKGMTQNNLDFIRRLFAESAFYDLRGRLSDVHAPALILHGERDRFISFACSQLLNQQLEDSELHVVADSGHLPNVENPKDFNSLVESFTKRIFGN